MSSQIKTIALIPVRGLDNGKTRLALSLSNLNRSRLVEYMLTDLISVLRSVSAVDEIWVVSADARASLGDCRHVKDPGSGLNTALSLGVSEASSIARTVLILAADLPLITQPDVEKLLAAAESSSVIIVPDRHGTGTNALVLGLPTAVEPQFGPDSCRLHMNEARTRGASHCVMFLQSLARDIDIPEDVDVLVKCRPHRYGFLQWDVKLPPLQPRHEETT